jgi:hypothetical protein
MTETTNQTTSPTTGGTTTVDDLVAFVCARLDDDERRVADRVLPHLDEAERRGRIRVLRTDDGAGLLVSADPVEGDPVPFHEKAAFLRREAGNGRDEDVLRLVAAVYDTHPDWREEWRPTNPPA